MRLACPVLAGAMLLTGATGCHSSYVEAVVQNRTGKPVSLLEVDYPSASFGTQTLAANADFHYRFKLQGNGQYVLLYTDAEKRDHRETGPEAHEGDEGSLTITLGRTGVSFVPSIDSRR